jgi:amidase
MARTARDAAILLGVLAGVDEQDAVTQESSGHARTDYTAFLDESGLQGARLGVARNFFGFHEDVDSLMDSALEAMKNAGATLVDTDMLSDVSQAGPAKGTVFKFELKAGMASYLSRLGADAPVKTLKDIIEFNDRHKDQEMSYFGQDFFLAAEAKGPLTEYEYQEALAKCRRLARTEGIDAALEKLQLDALIAPTTGPAWVTDLVCGDNWLGSSTSPAAIAGYPSVTVPAGSVFGLPVGISFFGRAWSEPTLLKYAYAFEQATKLRRPPQFRPTIKQA